MNCPKCESSLTIKNGSRKNEKQNFKCLLCGRQFVANPSPHYQIPQETMDLVDRLLLEKIPLAGIARQQKCPRDGCKHMLPPNMKQSLKKQLLLPKKKPSTVECDEMWSFVGNKKNKQWIWLAIDRNTREIIGVHVAVGTTLGTALWDSLPPGL
jgi:hypothetical protein